MTEYEEDLQPLEAARPGDRPPTAPAPASPSSGEWMSAPPAGRAQTPVLAIVGLVVLMLVAGVAGFAVESSLRSGKRFPTAASTPVPTVDRNAAILRQLIVRQSDVGNNYGVQLLTNGTSVGPGAVTLDLCNGTYASEAQRTARRQNFVADASGNTVLSTEAVLYRRAADTEEAFKELRAVAARCPKRPVPSPYGLPTVTTTFGARPDAAWASTPKVDRLAFDANTVDAQGQAFRSLAVYLRRGRVLLGVYFSQLATQPPIAGQTSAAAITRVFASRMAALDNAAVG